MKKSTVRLVGIVLTLIMLLPLVSCGTRMRDFKEAITLLEEKGYEVTSLPLFMTGNFGNSLLTDAGFPIDTADLEWVVDGKKTTATGTVDVFIIGFTDEEAADKGIEGFKDAFLTQTSAASNIFEIQEEGDTVYCIANGEVHMMIKQNGSIICFGPEQNVIEITD